MFKTLIYLAITTAILLLAAFFFLNFYTNHDDALVKVPEIEGMRIDKALRTLEEGEFEYEITDTVYRNGLPLLAIVDQNPVPGFKVKKGRKVYLILNSEEVPEVEMPNLAGKTSYQQAVRMLINRGLKLGKVLKVPDSHIKDPDSQPVLKQRLSGDSTEISPGTKIKRNTVIDLVVGTMWIQSDDEVGDGEVQEPELWE
jgi:eukaryotic-like serine/threonine-protein kinase